MRDGIARHRQALPSFARAENLRCVPRRCSGGFSGSFSRASYCGTDGKKFTRCSKPAMKVRLTQIDGSLPNLALMKLAHWHKSNSDDITLTRSIQPLLWEPEYGKVYGSAIFRFSGERLAAFEVAWPQAIIGGTGTMSNATVEALIGSDYEHYDYSGYPAFDASIG